MGDLNLKGVLGLKGVLKLNPSGGRVLVGGKEALVVLPIGQKHGDAAAPVIQPPPPAAPLDEGLDVVVFVSLNQTVQAGDKAIVTQGMVMQGTKLRAWPGMVQPSTNNPTVKINGIAINVQNDMAIIFPSGGTATLGTSGQ
ncbi:MAG TPA: hypothetical protein VF570_02665 [Pyrinomonadaceae bacterium]